jgi:dolichol-phosphate mannosyltransferase
MQPKYSVPGDDLAMLDSPSTKVFELSIIIPTRNEAGNVHALLDKINQVTNNIHTEVLFVDDSTDETPQTVIEALPLFPGLNVRLLHREPEQRIGGLGGAVLLGLINSRSDYACVMDGDLQHPPELLPTLLNTAHEKDVDLVVATRRTDQSQLTGLNVTRNLISRGLDLAARAFFPRRLRGVSDPLSGFFLVRVNAVNLSELQPSGFKILLDILIRNPKLRKAEIPFHFGERLSGKSKASYKEALNYLNLLLRLKFGSGSMRLAGFALVGATGIAVNSLVLYLATSLLNIYYLYSVVIATVASTIWNFIFTEIWVYQSGKQSSGRVRRFALFSSINIGALALRGPLIFVLTSTLGIYYLISNLITLILMIGVRFLLADFVIWGRKPANSTTYGGSIKSQLAASKFTYSYNIHDLVSVVSEGELPELEPFRVYQEIEKPTIRVRIGIPPAPKSNGSSESNYLRYREVLGHIGFEAGIWMGEQVDVVASPLLRFSPHVLYTNIVEPILRWTFVKKGYALVHGATIAFGSEAFIITARTDTGKTTTLLKILSHQRRNSDQAAFLSDDMTIVSPDGMAFTYPKPLTISAHTLSAINAKTLKFKEKLSLPLQSRIHSRTGRKVASFINDTILPAATINMFMQMVVPPPKYFVNKLLPSVKLRQNAYFTGMFIIERGGDGTTSISNEEALQILLSNCEDAYGFPPYNDLKEFLYHYNGVDLRSIEQRIIRQAFGGLPANVVRSKKLDWWCLIPTFIDERVASDCICEDERLISPKLETARSLTGD